MSDFRSRNMMYPLVIVTLMLPMFVMADYKCLCSYSVETRVYADLNQSSPTLGFMFEFDCKATVQNLTRALPANWQAVAFKHQVGYVRTDQEVQTQRCPGIPPDADALTTPPILPTTSTTPVTTASTAQTTTPTTTIESTTTSTTTRATTTSTTIKPTPAAPVRQGDVSLCPHVLHQYTIEDQGALGQYGDSCYEIVPIRTTWLKAEKDCVAKGGYLFHISNQQEQDFILQFINSKSFAHACWMGLNDLIMEESFDWISGDNITYTNWWHDRKGNFFSHHTEDCVLFVPYSPYNGKWDDVPCGTTNALGTDQGQINPFICQFSIHGHFTYVPLSSGFGKRNSEIKDQSIRGTSQAFLDQASSAVSSKFDCRSWDPELDGFVSVTSESTGLPSSKASPIKSVIRHAHSGLEDISVTGDPSENLTSV